MRRSIARSQPKEGNFGKDHVPVVLVLKIKNSNEIPGAVCTPYQHRTGKHFVVPVNQYQITLLFFKPARQRKSVDVH